MYRPKKKLLSGMQYKSSSLLTLNEIESLENSLDWRKNYTIKPKEIGRGHFSKVYHVSCDNHGLTFAAKVIRRRKGGIDRLEKIKQEASLIKKLNELGVESVIRLFDSFENFKEVVLILELAKGGSLFKLVEESDCGLMMDYVKVVTYKLLKALEIMHKENIVHLDIKADNILLREPYPSTDIALCDFGLATQLIKDHCHKELVGTPDYMAPEVINYENVTVNADMWSVGVFVYYLLTGLSPFMGTSKDETLSNVSRVNISFDLIFNQSEYIIAKDFVLKLCVKCPEMRLSSTDSQNHAWFHNIEQIASELSTPSSDTFTNENSNILNQSLAQSCSNLLISCENINMNATEHEPYRLVNVREVNDEVSNNTDGNNHHHDSIDGIIINAMNEQRSDPIRDPTDECCHELPCMSTCLCDCDLHSNDASVYSRTQSYGEYLEINSDHSATEHSYTNMCIALSKDHGIVMETLSSEPSSVGVELNYLNSSDLYMNIRTYNNSRSNCCSIEAGTNQASDNTDQWDYYQSYKSWFSNLCNLC